MLLGCCSETRSNTLVIVAARFTFSFRLLERNLSNFIGT